MGGKYAVFKSHLFHIVLDSLMNRLLILCEENKPKCSGSSVVSAHSYGWDEGTFTSASLLLVKLYCFWLPQPAPFFLIVSLSLVIPPHLIWWIISLCGLSEDLFSQAGTLKWVWIIWYGDYTHEHKVEADMGHPSPPWNAVCTHGDY